MKDLFAKRRWDFHQQCLKYLRYVFNDHFTIVLFIFLGFLVVQYQNLLAHFPSQHWPVYVVLVVLSLVLLYAGRMATYLEPADQVFLLPKEADVITSLKKAWNRAYLFWAGLQTVVLVILMPVFMALGWSRLGFMVFLVVMLVLKGLVMTIKHTAMLTKGRLNWDEMIAMEQGRKQGILKFFALFTTVKGISSRTKRRAYLDGLLKHIPKNSSHLWSHLFARAYLRSADYLGLSLRLFLLSLLSISLISQPLIGAALSILFNFLLLFQLLALYRHYDYQYLTELYPVGTTSKKANFKQFMRLLVYLMTALELLVSFLVSQSLVAGLTLLLASLVLVEIYLPFKLKKVIDEGS